MTWEYKIVYFSAEPLLDEDQYESRLHNGVHILNELGGQGWELVQFLEHPISKEMRKYHAVLKRPLASF
jgi:hypothetical protein